MKTGCVQKHYYENGKILYETTLKNGKQNGIYKEYYESGELKFQTSYTNGKVNSMVKL